MAAQEGAAAHLPAARHQEDPVTIRFAGETFEPLASGALFWRARSTLLVADLHLEKMASFARSGQLLPPYDTGRTLRQLEADLRHTRATKVIALGDSFHRDEGTSTLLPPDRARLTALLLRHDWTWIAGNHDPAPHGLGGRCVAKVDFDGLQLVHDPRHGDLPLITGHLHPAARVRVNGRSTRRSCFALDQRLMILPAYGASTGSLNILSPAFSGLFDHGSLRVFMLGRDRVYPVSNRHLTGG